MLGKTNITALSEGGIVTEIEDFKWIQVQSGIYGNFVKAIYKGGYLAAITADGSVVYTADGEVWNTVTLEYENCRLNDIDWDGNRYILAGCYSDENISDTDKVGLLITTIDFKTFSEVGETLQYAEYHSVMPQNGKYILTAEKKPSLIYLYALFTDLTTVEEQQLMRFSSNGKIIHYITSKNSDEILIYCHVYENDPYSSTDHTHTFWRISNGVIYTILNNRNSINAKMASTFECKDTMYFMYLLSEKGYALNKVTVSNEVLTMSTEQNFGFVDGAYFDGCELFINAHEMLIVRKGESVSDKTVEDLIEIAPEMTMNCITKAYGQLYLFGNQGVILKSSVETDNEEAITVQTLSAKKALADAKAYADAIYEELEARIASLEKQGIANL